MEDEFEILFIDDECETWLPALQTIGNSFGFHVTSAHSVEEGLEFLSKYPGMFDAVILDLTFPETPLQGKDGLLHIGESGELLPILVLTRNSSEEHIRTAVECVKLGAYDYFPKNTLDPHQLFIQARNAIEASRRYRQRSRFADAALQSTIKPHLHVVQSESGLFTSTFAFVLGAMVIPRNRDELDSIAATTLAWHHSVITYFSQLDPSVTITLRYMYKPPPPTVKPRILPVLVVSIIDSSSQSVVRKSDLLSKELSFYLRSNFQSPSVVYTFIPVSSEEGLLSILKPLGPAAIVRLVRRTVKRKKSDIGFSTAKSTTPTQTTDMLLSLPLPAARSTFYDLCSQLIDQKHITVVDCVLRPGKLKFQEVDILRETSSRKGIEQIDLPTEKVESLVQYSAKVLEEATQCVSVEIHLKQDSKEIPRPLILCAITEFFGQVARVEIQPIQDNETPRVVGERFPSIFTPDEAINLFHFPFPVPGGIPGIPATHTAHEFLPEPIGQAGPLLGIKRLGDHARPILIDPQDLRRHVYILGQTGTGKTTLLYSMIHERLHTGAGVGLIDPHGDLWNHVYTSIPQERIEDTVIFDPTNPRSALALNMLEYDHRFPEQKTFLIHEMFNIFWQFYDYNLTAGPMFEYYMRNGMLLVMDDPHDPGTLPDVVKVFQDDKYRQGLIEKCKDEQVVDFWRREAERAGGEASLRNMSPYITSKLNMFIQNHYVRPIISQKRTEINFRDIIDNKKILLVKLTKGKLGDLGVKLFGTVLFAKLLMAALSRENIPEKSRQDFALFVDEFQNFTSDSIADALSEARKYRLSMVLANQALGQLKEQILKSVLGNVGSLIFFRPGVEDMPKIEPYVSPPFTKEEMLNLPNFTAVGRLQVYNAPTPPFMFETLPPEVLKQE